MNTNGGNKSFETYFEFCPIMVQAACLKFRDCCYDVPHEKAYSRIGKLIAFQLCSIHRNSLAMSE